MYFLQAFKIIASIRKIRDILYKTNLRAQNSFIEISEHKPNLYGWKKRINKRQGEILKDDPHPREEKCAN